VLDSKEIKGKGSNQTELLSQAIVGKLNRCVVVMCEGKLREARTLFDEVLALLPSSDEAH
jgi:hypothetical protein